jgi:hypothetical protein
MVVKHDKDGLDAQVVRQVLGLAVPKVPSRFIPARPLRASVIANTLDDKRFASAVKRHDVLREQGFRGTLDPAQRHAAGLANSAAILNGRGESFAIELPRARPAVCVTHDMPFA